MREDSKNIKNFWSADEDLLLKHLIEVEGVGHWPKISCQIPGRTSKQCRERWINHLNNGIRKGEWTKEEDEMLLNLRVVFGNQWSKISPLLNGRVDNDVKNRFHVLRRIQEKSLISSPDSVDYQSVTIENLKTLQKQRSIEYDSSEESTNDERPVKSIRTIENSSPSSSVTESLHNDDDGSHFEQEILNFLASDMDDYFNKNIYPISENNSEHLQWL